MANGRSANSGVSHEWDTDSEEMPMEAESAAIEKQLRKLLRQSKEGTAAPLAQYDDNDESQEDEDGILPALAHVIDLTVDTPSTRPRSDPRPTRNDPVKREAMVKQHDFNGSVLEPGVTVEIDVVEPPSFFKASFLYINHIISTPDGIMLRGIPLTRLRNLRGRLPRLRNELAMILHVDNNDKRPEEVQAAIEIPVTDVIKVRNCHFTNADFPVHRTVLGIYTTSADQEAHGVLMCRWRLIFKYRNAATRIGYIEQSQRQAAPFEYIIEHIKSRQLSKKRFEVSETSRFNAWRGGKVRGGEHDPTSARSLVKGPVVQLEEKQADPEVVLIEKKRGQKYTFGDMFCGAGGASLGARKAGFQIKIGCDHHLGACRTYSRVFPEADLHYLDIFDFIRKESRTRVDVLHLSPPCQVWSPAHTCAGVNDEANIAVLSSCHQLIKKFRPRLFTLEQTFGILHPKFEYYFNALIHGFTESSYSVRWKVVDLVDWGSPATRKRLVMLGSCPGEELPTIPKPTHVPPELKRRGKKTYLTVKKMLARIPRDMAVTRPRQHDDSDFNDDYDDDNEDDMHNPYEMMRKRLPRWDADVTLRRCITTNGGYGNYHPNGRRDFTLREYATLQTFPLTYPFQIPNRKQQIGNAFPPMVVKVLFTHLRKWLERQDGVYAIENEPIDPDDPDVEFFDLEGDNVDMLEGEDGEDGDDVEYMGEQPLDGLYEEMEIDDSDDDYDVIPCADVNQQRRVWPPIDLTEGDNVIYLV
ncbi:S-adenosyl-L-methionine-dependent methyltransferase [Xylaria intraflava]|nr:S-adenosyl-L-methionine-dependent methyltransferase [Xylaria intraflava]